MVDEREVLRRRLYARGATEEDRRRYAAVAPDRPRSRRRRPRAPASVLLAAAVLVAAGGAALTGRLAGPEPRALPRPTVAAAVPLTRSLISGTAERIPVEVDGVHAVAQRLRGVGEALVPIDTAAASSEGGSVLVALASSEPVQMSWEAVRPDRTVSREVVALSAPADRRGARDPVIARYTGDPPLWIRVHAPAGALWTLTVALARTSDPRLR